jgi:hypothetical protein
MMGSSVVGSLHRVGVLPQLVESETRQLTLHVWGLFPVRIRCVTLTVDAVIVGIELVQ